MARPIVLVPQPTAIQMPRRGVCPQQSLIGNFSPWSLAGATALGEIGGGGAGERFQSAGFRGVPRHCRLAKFHRHFSHFCLLSTSEAVRGMVGSNGRQMGG